MTLDARPSHTGVPDEGGQVFREVLRRFSIPPGTFRIEQPAHATGFSGATIRRIAIDVPQLAKTTSAQPWTALCLRGWPRPGLPPARLNELHCFLKFVRDQGIDIVPVPIPSTNGETLVSHGGRQWQLEPWLPGVADFSRAPTDVRRRSAMTALAQIHQAASRYQPTLSGHAWFSRGSSAPSPAIAERLNRLEHWTSERLQQAAELMRGDPQTPFGEIATRIIERFRCLQAQVRTELVSMLHTPVPLQVCLRDVWHDHVLFTGDDVTGIVDPSAARTENVAADLSRLLGSLLGKPSEKWERALETYAHIRPLSDVERRLIDVLHHSGILLSSMTWIDRRLRGEIPTDVLPAVTVRLKNFCSQL